jgi:hypothetical protein
MSDYFPWCVVEDGGVSDRYATRAEAEDAIFRPLQSVVFQPWHEPEDDGIEDAL